MEGAEEAAADGLANNPFVEIGLPISLFVIMIGVFIATFDANAYKQELSGLVKQQTGRDLAFTGDIGLTLYPSLGMKLGAMSLSNAPGFGDQPMVTVQHASISVDVLSILSLAPEREDDPDGPHLLVLRKS